MQRLTGRRAALAVGLAGAALTTMGASRCGTTSGSTVTVSGSTLTIYASAPSSSAGPASTDVLDAERLALNKLGLSVGKFTIRFVQLHRKASDNARTAIQDKSAIAYIGELEPGTSAGTLGITNAQDLLQVSPTDNALELTQSTPAVPGAPGNYYEAKGTYGQTFARVVPSSAAEAKAQVKLMQSLHVSRLYVANDGSDYGKAIAYAVKQDAPSSGITIAQAISGADAMFFGGLRPASFPAPPVKLFVPSALASAALPSGTYVSQPGLRAHNSTTTQFDKQFEAQYGHVPATEAIFGYEAMAAVLAVIKEAGTDATNRTTVVHDFLALNNRASVLGTYSIDSNGDTSIAPFVVSRVRNGVLVPFR